MIYTSEMMVRYTLILITCMCVMGAMAFILTRFFRRLHAIEEERWGKMKDWASGLQMTRGDRRKKQNDDS